jgi:2-polyprenyl-3-methyl-5-hydroxy-6-metoxy-1,4-benzoquinol methylase
MPTTTTQDPFTEFKAAQREGWALFAPLEAMTTPPAATLVNFVAIKPGESVLDVGCGTGVTTVTAARKGAKVTGLDLTPALLERAKFNAQQAGVTIDWHEGDAEALPFKDQQFDVVISQFGHMFAPRPAVAVAEMLRVLKPGGRIAFSTWPPELFTGRMFALVGKHLPPPAGAAAPPQWGDPATIRERLGDAVSDITFDRSTMSVSTPFLQAE